MNRNGADQSANSTHRPVHGRHDGAAEAANHPPEQLRVSPDPESDENAVAANESVAAAVGR